jgi:hypothetical protein
MSTAEAMLMYPPESGLIPWLRSDGSGDDRFNVFLLLFLKQNSTVIYYLKIDRTSD